MNQWQESRVMIIDNLSESFNRVVLAIIQSSAEAAGTDKVPLRVFHGLEDEHQWKLWKYIYIYLLGNSNFNVDE